VQLLKETNCAVLSDHERRTHHIGWRVLRRNPLGRVAPEALEFLLGTDSLSWMVVAFPEG
jgi:hypothetical protein